MPEHKPDAIMRLILRLNPSNAMQREAFIKINGIPRGGRNAFLVDCILAYKQEPFLCVEGASQAITEPVMRQIVREELLKILTNVDGELYVQTQSAEKHRDDINQERNQKDSFVIQAPEYVHTDDDDPDIDPKAMDFLMGN